MDTDLSSVVDDDYEEVLNVAKWCWLLELTIRHSESPCFAAILTRCAFFERILQEVRLFLRCSCWSVLFDFGLLRTSTHCPFEIVTVVLRRIRSFAPLFSPLRLRP